MNGPPSSLRLFDPAEEAIPERNPEYQLPPGDAPTTDAVPWTVLDLAVWRWLLRHRPCLAALHRGQKGA